MVVPRLLRRLVLRAGARPEAMISYSRAARHKGRNLGILPESRWRQRALLFPQLTAGPKMSGDLPEHLRLAAIGTDQTIAEAG